MNRAQRNGGREKAYLNIAIHSFEDRFEESRKEDPSGFDAGGLLEGGTSDAVWDPHDEHQLKERDKTRRGEG